MSITRQEAIEELKADVAMYDNEICRLDLFKDDGDGRLIQALEMGIEAIKKQLPRKPYYARTSGGESGYMCGCCLRLLHNDFPNYCGFCGNSVDWSDV